MHTVTVINSQVNNVYTQFYGGFLDYFKLTVDIWKQANSLSLNFGFFTTVKVFLILLVKSIWWIFIKPFAQIFSIKTHIKGSFESINNKIPKTHNLKKHIYIQLFKIPFFCFPANINIEDWENLLK